MRPTDEIKQTIQNAKIKTNPAVNDAVLTDLLTRLKTAGDKKQFASQPNIWRTIMKNRISKFAVTAILFGIAFLIVQTVSTPAALAIDRTIQAIGKLDSLHVAGIHISEEGRLSDIEIWTKAHSENPKRSGDFREEVKGVRISVASEEKNITYRYFPVNHQVHIMAGLQNSVKPFWPDGDFFRELKEKAIDWQEIPGKDQDGNQCIIVTCSYTLDRLPDRYFTFWFKFDPDTMLPTHMKIRDLSKTRGPQEYDFDVIEFNQPLSNNLFEFNIPEGAEVIDER